MNTFTAEDRTGTYPQRRDIYWRPGPGDEQFERQLPRELHAELEAAPQRHRLREIAPPYLRPAPASRPETVFRLPPVRPPETEEEIEQALQWLKSQGYLRSTSPAPPPVSPPLPEPVVAPQLPPVVPQNAVQSASGPGPGHWVWLLLMLLAIPVLSALQTHRQAQSQPQWIELRRALPAVPRALPVTTAVSDPQLGPWHTLRFLDGTVVQACYGGQLQSPAELVTPGRFLGDERIIGNHSWIWMTRPGSTLPAWVDP